MDPRAGAAFPSIEELRGMLLRLGPYGPLAVIVLMAVAVVVSPLPSAPLTVLAGAIYGHLWGTVYALAGALIGAMIAFAIARALGRSWVEKITKEAALPAMLGSQNALMLGVGLARLIPAVSFDAVSYLAGLTPLTATRFAIATFFGMVPMTFLFSHAGAAMTVGDGARAWTVTGLVAEAAAGLAWAANRSMPRGPKPNGRPDLPTDD